MRSEQTTIGDIEYILNAGTAVKAFELIKKGGVLLKGADLSKVDKSSGGELISILLGNLQEPVVNEIQDFVYSNIVVKIPNGQPFRLQDKKDEHFNNYPEHMLPLLVKGAKFQFTPFFNSFSQITGDLKL
ncbi:phage tail assembly chaperone [Entomomonas asaccharolytica]|uniref:Uncharacterized protein n=1 Tax=Entomomonas asaccharolytica TaxID=2785331 RepID=A0A974RY61_9GAMM|nr:putative phage tail assembly chaperone [Entomomonas asaccharolytica]QQP86945.1 hypothetical protein JHT90_06785 [Entomomonas asaccharolytica]